MSGGRYTQHLPLWQWDLTLLFRKLYFSNLLFTEHLLCSMISFWGPEVNSQH